MSETVVTTPARPTRKTHELEIRERAEPAVIRLLKEWYANESPEISAEELQEQAKSLIEESCCYHDNGYELAKHLEDKFYAEPDLDLVERLDGIRMEVSKAERALVEEWAKVNAITCPFAVGQKVNPAKSADWILGEIVAIHLADAKCTVFIPSLGHVRKGCGTHGQVLKYEDLKAVVQS